MDFFTVESENKDTTKKGIEEVVVKEEKESNEKPKEGKETEVKKDEKVDFSVDFFGIDENEKKRFNKRSSSGSYSEGRKRIK
jgi:hypothetical protein